MNEIEITLLFYVPLREEEEIFIVIMIIIIVITRVGVLRLQFKFICALDTTMLIQWLRIWIACYFSCNHQVVVCLRLY